MERKYFFQDIRERTEMFLELMKYLRETSYTIFPFRLDFLRENTSVLTKKSRANITLDYTATLLVQEEKRKYKLEVNKINDESLLDKISKLKPENLSIISRNPDLYKKTFDELFESELLARIRQEYTLYEGTAHFQMSISPLFDVILNCNPKELSLYCNFSISNCRL